MSKKRILHVLGKLQMGGAETLVMNLYRNIDKEKIQFDFLVHGDEIGAYEEEIIKMGGKIYRIPKYKVYNHLEYKNALNNFFKNHLEYKIIHCHIRSTASIILKIAKKYGVKTICHSHNTSNGTGIKSIIKKILQRNIPKYSDYLFACSNESAEWLYGNKNKKYYIINNAIDCNKFAYKQDVRKKIRKEYDLTDKFVIGQVGRLENVKNHLFTLRVLNECLKTNKNCYLLIIGSGTLKNEIITTARKMNIENNILILENRTDVNDLMQAMDVFIMPSLYEGLPLVLVEAQAASLPCVVSENVMSGILVDELVEKISLNISVEEWANCIFKKKNFTRKNYIDVIVKKGFDVSSNVKWLEKFYSEI